MKVYVDVMDNSDFKNFCDSEGMFVKAFDKLIDETVSSMQKHMEKEILKYQELSLKADEEERIIYNIKITTISEMIKLLDEVKENKQ